MEGSDPQDETAAARRARPDAETAADGSPAGAQGPRPVPSGVPLPPGYRLVRPLGAGGMGAVYLVEHEASGARRALKVLADGGDVDRRARFRRELDALVAVDGHPNVVRVHAGGEGPRAAWLLLSLAEGGDLEERLARGPLPPAEVLRLGVALARGLAHVHARGVLHRDLKPGNVLFDAAGEPLLVDFGLARLEGATRLTVTGTLLGTPLYLAPEQARAAHGRSGDDPRIDVWGLGAVLYHCATGRPPFLAEALPQLVAAIQVGEPRPPRELAPGLSPALEAVILRCLEKQPARRFPSAAAVGEALAAASAAPAGLAGGWPLSLVLGALAVGALATCVALLAGQGAATTARPDRGPAAATEAARVRVDQALAEVEAALAAEDGDAALRLLAPLPAGAPRLAAWRVAALALATEPARAAFEATADDAGRAAARAARALAGEVGAPAPAETLRGSGQLLRRRAALRAAHDEWRQRAAAPEVASLVGPSVGHDAARGEALAALAPAVSALLEAAAGWPERGPERVLRVLAQRELLAVDAGLVVAGLDLLVPMGLAAGPAAGALERVRRWERVRAERDLSGCGARNDLGPPLPPLALDGPYRGQALVGLALDVLAAPHDADALPAGLRTWDLLAREAAAAGWAAPTDEAARAPDEAERAALLLDAAAARSSLLAWSAWYARATPAAEERLEAARRAAEALPPRAIGAAAYHVARVRLLAGEVAQVPAAMERVPAHLRSVRSDEVIALERGLLQGDTRGARRMVADVFLTGGTAGLGRVTWSLAQAELAALEGDHRAAAALIAQVRAELERDPRLRVQFLPWRTPEATERIVAAIQRGWRPWDARRPAPDWRDD